MTLKTQPVSPLPLDPLAATPELDPTHYQHELYLGEPSRNPVLSAYYALKPAIPRDVQLWVRRLYARRQARRVFPAWPIEPVLVDHVRNRLRAAVQATGGARVPMAGSWPAPWQSACVLTHDVEGPAGIESIDGILEIEQRHGMRSAWNFVAEDYPIPPGLREASRRRLRDRTARHSSRRQALSDPSRLSRGSSRRSTAISTDGGLSASARRRRTGAPNGCTSSAACMTARTRTRSRSSLSRAAAARSSHSCSVTSSSSRSHCPGPHAWEVLRCAAVDAWTCKVRRWTPRQPRARHYQHPPGLLHRLGTA